MSPNGVVYVTAEGLQKLKEELDQLVNVRHGQAVEHLEQALASGDLDGNADYEDAKQELDLIEERIADLQDTLRHVALLEEPHNPEEVSLGSTVTIREEADEECETYRIVTVYEANPMEGLISDESPLANALLGSKVGDVVIAHTPGGDTRYVVTAIE